MSPLSSVTQIVLSVYGPLEFVLIEPRIQEYPTELPIAFDFLGSAFGLFAGAPKETFHMQHVILND
jgi:hypothetical protein